LRRACVAIGWAIVAAIIWLSLTPSPPQVDVPYSDKIGHLASYGVLMSWFCQLYRTRIFYAAGFILMGVALEFVQRELGYRSYEVADMLANALGVLLGWGVALLLPKPLLK
jgi:VanZ family protein